MSLFPPTQNDIERELQVAKIIEVVKTMVDAGTYDAIITELKYCHAMSLAFSTTRPDNSTRDFGRDDLVVFTKSENAHEHEETGRAWIKINETCFLTFTYRM